jgi:SAM-dependent methyltransferase
MSKRAARGKRKPAHSLMAGARGHELLGALHLLRERRAPYAELLAGIVQDTLDRYPPDAEGTVVEVGAGTGQLSAWLPPHVSARIVYTDPSEAALAAFAAEHPQVDARVASADKLPFAEASAAAVLGLCVFDALLDEAAAAREIGRILRPGGLFVHFLDMATLLERPFEQVAKTGMVPIPNVFADPAEHAWPLDVVLIPGDWLKGLLRLARQAGHPLYTEFGRFFELFLATPFQREKATQHFKSLASSSERRNALLTALTSAGQVTSAYGYPAMQAWPFHSGRYLLSVLSAAFGDPESFRIELAEVVTRAAYGPASPDARPRYRSLCLGHERRFDDLPVHLLTDISPDDAAAKVNAGQQTLTEVGVFVFVARRLPALRTC